MGWIHIETEIPGPASLTLIERPAEAPYSGAISLPGLSNRSEAATAANNNCVRFLNPLTTTDDQVDEALVAIGEAFDAVVGERSHP